MSETSIIKLKAKEQAEIEKAKQEYLAKGGVITQLPLGVVKQQKLMFGDEGHDY